jgi:hypothetical protein
MKSSLQQQRTLREVKRLRKQFLALRRRAGKMRREERALLQRLATTLRGGKAAHLMTTKPRRGGKEVTTEEPVSGSLTSVARMRGGSGLFCECAPILIKPQPNEDIDICILIDCSNDPSTSGFHCSYYCLTLVAPPIVGMVKRPGRRRR